MRARRRDGPPGRRCRARPDGTNGAGRPRAGSGAAAARDIALYAREGGATALSVFVRAGPPRGRPRFTGGGSAGPVGPFPAVIDVVAEVAHLEDRAVERA